METRVSSDHEKLLELEKKLSDSEKSCEDTQNNLAVCRKISDKMKREILNIKGYKFENQNETLLSEVNNFIKSHFKIVNKITLVKILSSKDDKQTILITVNNFDTKNEILKNKKECLERQKYLHRTGPLSFGSKNQLCCTL